MIKKRLELITEAKNGLKNGRGEVQVIDILTTEEMGKNGRLYAITVIPPKCSIGPHMHIGDYETYFITKGKAEVNDGGTIYQLSPGDVAICEDGSFHSIKNIGDGNLEYVALILYSNEQKV